METFQNNDMIMAKKKKFKIPSTYIKEKGHRNRFPKTSFREIRSLSFEIKILQFYDCIPQE